MQRKSATVFSASVLLAGLPFANLFRPAARPPSAPAEGPGGSRYAHRAVVQSTFESGAEQFWIYEPADPAPRSAPVVVLLHGWLITNPMYYGAWIDHLVRRGNIVVYPKFQVGLFTPPNRFTANAIQAVRSALRVLQSGDHVRPQSDHFAVVGHSAGAVVAANLAAAAADNDLPIPKALMLVEPSSKAKGWFVPFGELGRIAPETLLLVVVGDRDFLTLDVGARQILKATRQIPTSNKDYIRIVSDTHGRPDLIADHFSPFALDTAYDSAELLKTGIVPAVASITQSVNALDYFGYWKLFDGLTEAAFFGRNRRYALGNTPEQRYMGTWSDGTPVRELEVLGHP